MREWLKCRAVFARNERGLEAAPIVAGMVTVTSGLGFNGAVPNMANQFAIPPNAAH